MTPLVPIMLFGWIPFTIILFFVLKPHQAVLISIIGGVLFLPMARYDLPGLPTYSKSTAIALGLILGGRLSGHRRSASFKMKIYDMPMVIWCLCPIATSLSNQLGIYDALAAAFEQTIMWGVPYLAGRVYFNNYEGIRDLCLGVVIGGMLYIPLCLYEIRMSPQLSIDFYGFFPHSFGQQMRYGGFRPVVFMQHGLMVALWMAIVTTVSFWMWRSKEILYIKGIPLGFVFVMSAVTTILCKTAGGWVALVIGCGSFFFYNNRRSTVQLQLLLLIVPLYIIVRLTGLVTGETLVATAAHFFDADRVSSLEYRIEAEDLYSNKAFERPLLGWGGYGRNRVTNTDNGRKIKKAIDSFWLIYFGSRGLVGLISFLISMLIGPLLILRISSKQIDESMPSPYIPVVLSLCVILFMIDSLLNGMFNPVYILISGVLVSYYSSFGVDQHTMKKTLNHLK